MGLFTRLSPEEKAERAETKLKVAEARDALTKNNKNLKNYIKKSELIIKGTKDSREQAQEIKVGVLLTKEQIEKYEQILYPKGTKIQQELNKLLAKKTKVDKTLDFKNIQAREYSDPIFKAQKAERKLEAKEQRRIDVKKGLGLGITKISSDLQKQAMDIGETINQKSSNKLKSTAVIRGKQGRHQGQQR